MTREVRSGCVAVSLAECLVLWFCVSLLCDRHRPSCVHPYRVGVPVVGRTVFRLPINQSIKACIDQDSIDASLLGLPIYVSGCTRLLVLDGPSYALVLRDAALVHHGGAKPFVATRFDSLLTLSPMLCRTDLLLYAPRRLGERH